MMNVLVIMLIVFAVLALAFLSCKVHRFGFGILRTYLRKAIKTVFAASSFLLVACFGLLLCYSGVSEALKSVLSLESVDGIKLFVRLLTGVDSVFVALQSVAFATFMVSAVSCMVYLCGKLTVYLYSYKANVKGAIKTEERIKANTLSFPAVKSFLVYSKYNS